MLFYTKIYEFRRASQAITIIAARPIQKCLSKSPLFALKMPDCESILRIPDARPIHSGRRLAGPRHRIDDIPAAGPGQ